MQRLVGSEFFKIDSKFSRDLIRKRMGRMGVLACDRSEKYEFSAPLSVAAAIVGTIGQVAPSFWSLPVFVP